MCEATPSQEQSWAPLWAEGVVFAVAWKEALAKVLPMTAPEPHPYYPWRQNVCLSGAHYSAEGLDT